MSDISLVCPECGRDVKISEHASGGSVPCPHCHREIAKPLSERATGRLALRSRQGYSPRSTVVVPGSVIRETPATRMGVFGPRSRVPGVHAFWICLLLAGGLMFLLQRVTAGRDNLWSVYVWLRLGLWVLVIIPVVIKAFNDSPTAGWLCLFIPPYLLYYVLERLDSYWMKGLFLGMLISLGTEWYFMGERAWVVIAQQKVTWLIERGHYLIKAAGEESVF